MKILFTFLVATAFSCTLLAQSTEPDTLLAHNFQGFLDPTDAMLNSPTGDDPEWINYDQDNKTGLCVEEPGITPKGWYWEHDLGFPDFVTPTNDAITSCSYLINQNYRNRNWLITPAVNIPSDSYSLCWRSLTYYGPDLMDGYQVLVSTGNNLTTSFTDTLFSASETAWSPFNGSLELSDYLFSPGYIHASNYTDTNYYYIDYENGLPFFHGRLEPHCVDLSAYAGQTIHLAFLHDSKFQYQLQLDDIVVANPIQSSTKSLNVVERMNILPNPVREVAYVSWSTEKPQSGQLKVLDQSGKMMFQQTFGVKMEGQIFIDTQHFPPGVYYCQLETALGQATRKMVKI